MGKLTKESSTFPQRLGKAAKNLAEFSSNVPLGAIMAVIPGIGLVIGGLAFGGYLERNIRYDNEDSDDYRKRLKLNEERKFGSTGMATGIIIGWLGQMWLLSKI